LRYYDEIELSVVIPEIIILQGMKLALMKLGNLSSTCSYSPAYAAVVADITSWNPERKNT
jgi:hypothetical protein